ncbi:DUF4334 domain-containing protein [Hyphobacterium sp. HN65]|uniref:DUF4334 domain-containing protein n=1 Tax=Hyphobacterium lacteum TaxID=3116575 RepID=A0ABU7LTX4_9PROT|nr:DUF4334 domain-containing protein [Hyphobacterium sp. HN65]MEE2527366.1 DUF4334 domain-containing protein [Hyphobacterium sp. HN65]
MQIAAQPISMSYSEAETLFDRLETVGIEFMIGEWWGREVSTGHNMDGSLAIARWYGKTFIDADNVHPLVHLDGRGRKFCADPGKMPFGPRMKTPNYPAWLLPLMRWGMKVHTRTERTRARLRMIEYRGRVSATMCYDQLPIHDVFRKLDDDNVLGFMDMKRMERPYVFTLAREGTAGFDFSTL